MKISASIIIPSYNSWRTIARTIEGVREQTRYDLVAEILVVDSSTDVHTRNVLSQIENEKLRVIDAGARVMPAKGRNLGAHQAEGNLLVFIDSDAYMAPDWLEKVAERVEQGCRLGGGSIVLPEFQWSKSIAAAQYFLQFNEFMDVGVEREKEFLPSCNMFCDRALFEELGGFPEIRAAEDVLFFLNAGKEVKPLFIPDARVFHIFREYFDGFAHNQKVLGEYILVYRRKWMKDKFYYKGLWPLFFLPGFLALKLASIAGRILRSRPALAFLFLRSSPWFLTGMFYWTAGFVSAIFKEEESGGSVSGSGAVVFGPSLKANLRQPQYRRDSVIGKQRRKGAALEP